MSFIKQYQYYLKDRSMLTTISISDLEYEELVLLQEIMIDVWEHGIAAGYVNYEKEIFDKLYDKVLRS